MCVCVWLCPCVQLMESRDAEGEELKRVRGDLSSALSSSRTAEAERARLVSEHDSTVRSLKEQIARLQREVEEEKGKASTRSSSDDALLVCVYV